MLKKINKFGRRVLFEERLLLSAIIVGCLLALYSFVGSLVLPNGINQVFAQRSWKFILLPTLLLLGVLFLSYWARLVRGPLIKKFERMDGTDLIILLLPLTPIARYAVLNLDSLTPLALVIFLVQAIAVCITTVVIVPHALSFIASKRVVALASGAYTYLLFDMASIAASHSWHMAGSLKLQLLILIVVMFVTMTLAAFSKKLLFIMLACHLVLSTVGPLMGQEPLIAASPKQREGNHESIIRLTNDVELKKKHDVIFLVYESYVNQETMKYYGYDNSAHIEYLKSLGFTTYDNNYTIAPSSLASISRTLNISTEIENMRTHLAGDSFVPNLMRDESYLTAGIFSSSYFVEGRQPIWDFYFPSGKKAASNIFKAVMEGEFRFDIIFDASSYEGYLEEKRRIIRDRRASPLFMYTHNRYPGHTQNSGRCLPHERQEYFNNIEVANNEMLADLRYVFSARPDAIVIIAGDHGPYQTKNCRGLSQFNSEEITRYDIQDRYGSFLAIRWPESAKVEYEISTLQDVFPAVLASLFDEPRIWQQGRTASRTIGNTAGQGIYVEDGTVHGGANDGERLYVGLN